MIVKMPDNPHHPASFRDPSGFVFRVKGVYYRQVQQSYAADYQRITLACMRSLQRKSYCFPTGKSTRTLPGWDPGTRPCIPSNWT